MIGNGSVKVREAVSLKVPTVRERASRVALAAVLACSMGCAAIVQPGQAFAEDGSITITAKDNQQAAYKVYELFKADIAAAPSESAANIDGIATHIKWAVSGAAYDRVHAFLLDNGMSKEDAANPQKAAEFIGKTIAGGPWDADAATVPQTPAAKSFANNLAQVLVSSGAAAKDYKSGSKFTSEEGYYLFVTDDGSLGNGEAGTAAAWVPLGGKTSTIVEKTSVPVLDKQVKEDSTGEFGHAADAEAAGDRVYRLTAEMPNNIGAYKKYHLQFTDTLPKGMETAGANTSSIVVKVGDVDVTGQLKREDITYSENVLRVNIPDVLALKNVSVNKDTIVSVEYNAHLTKDAVEGSVGNENSVVVTYTNDPVSLGEGKGSSGKTYTYSYHLALQKVDKATGENLSGAKITVQSKATGKYVQADGSLSDKAYEFTTGKDGTFEIARIDSGVYVLHEASAPKNYEPWDADVELTIQAKFDQKLGKLNELTATVKGGEATKTNDSDIVTNVSRVDAKSGKVSLQTSDDKKIPMPITGMSGISFAMVAGTGAVVVATAGLYLNHRRRRADDGTEA